MLILFCLLPFSFTYSMEHEEELMPFLEKKNILVHKKKDIRLDDVRKVKSSYRAEKLFLIRCMSPLLESKNIHIKIIEYMLQLDRDKIDQEIISHYQRKVASLQTKIHELSVTKVQYPCEITINVDNCVDALHGAAAGGCCGCMSGTMVTCASGMIEGYMWSCCNIAPSKTMCDILTLGFPVAAVSGCFIGACCAVTGLYKKIKFV